ncbi:MAG TPA: hypothetical protein VNX18_21290 [Bryobacteraceae bacterium]|nr:hypothetical protein [Bryobacteraceae bacterium]
MRTLLTSILLFTIPRLGSGPPEIARLDECIQHRFVDRTSFGMSRILPGERHGVRTFRPENPTEQSVVDTLRANGYQVALFLVGRNAMTSSPGLGYDSRRLGLQGPAFITPLTADLPDRDALLAESREALRKGEPYTVRQGDWTVTWKPLRASDSACLQCHTSGIAVLSSPLQTAGETLKVGDTLGVAVYLYKLR